MCPVGMMLRQQYGYNYRVTLNDCLANYIKSDSDFMDGIRRGLKACKEGKVKPWSEVKEELGIG